MRSTNGFDSLAGSLYEVMRALISGNEEHRKAELKVRGMLTHILPPGFTCRTMSLKMWTSCICPQYPPPLD